MRIARMLFVVVQLIVIAGAAGAGWVYAQQKSLPPMLSPADHLEILQLYNYYSRDVSSGTRRSAAWVYADDGVFIDGERRFTGQPLKDLYGNLQKTQKAGTRFIMTAPVVVPTAEGARASIYMMVVQRKAKDGPIEIGSFGKYEDRVVKTPKGWRFKERNFQADTFQGDDPSKILPSPFAPID